MLHLRKPIRYLLLFLFVLILGSRSEAKSDKEEALGFFESSAATIYQLAWPTAEYKEISLVDFRSAGNGFDFDLKLLGESGFSGGELWMIVTMEWRDGALHDMRVSKHNAILSPPFATVQSLGQLVVELSKDANSQSTPSVNTNRWVAGQPHPKIRGFVTAEEQGKWTTDHGYRLTGTENNHYAVWSPGQKHGSIPNIVAYETEGTWMPAPGYTWLDKSKMTVQWQKGIKYLGRSNVYSTVYQDLWEIRGDVGLVLELMPSYNHPVVTSVNAKSPSSKAGVQRGWLLVSTDGKSTYRQSLAETFSQLAGKVGSQVELKFYNPNSIKYVTKTLTRSTVYTRF